MNGLLVRVAADQSPGGGLWNSPVDSKTGEFVYVAIPEVHPNYDGLEKPFTALTPHLARMGVTLPPHLQDRYMHLDPDFGHLTYGDRGKKGQQLQAILRQGDIVIFYAGLADTRNSNRLVYAIIGLYVVEGMVTAVTLPPAERDINAHSRRMLKPYAQDIIVKGCPASSGRLERCIPIGEYRDRAYRVRKDLLKEWGGLSVNDGYIQRSARFPQILDMAGFIDWWGRQNPVLIQANN
jgi:hypothetical protein